MQVSLDLSLVFDDESSRPVFKSKKVNKWFKSNTVEVLYRTRGSKNNSGLGWVIMSFYAKLHLNQDSIWRCWTKNETMKLIYIYTNTLLDKFHNSSQPRGSRLGCSQDTQDGGCLPQPAFKLFSWWWLGSDSVKQNWTLEKAKVASVEYGLDVGEGTCTQLTER